MPSHQEVAEYWESRPLPGGQHVPIIDVGEPECFACGWSPLDRVRPTRKKINIWKGLQRAHVVARSLGGPNTVDNLVLLCDSCHRESPDTARPEVFWRWVNGHPRNGALSYIFTIKEFSDLKNSDYRGPGSKYVRALGSLTESEITDLAAALGGDSEEVRQLFSEAGKRLGGVTTHFGVGLSPGTLEALLREIAQIRLEGKPEA